MRTKAMTLAILLSLLMGTAWTEEVYKDNVVIVLDGSGSMGESMRSSDIMKMDAAKVALKEVLKQIPDTTNVGLVVFSASKVKDDWIYPLGLKNESKLMKAIDLPQPGGDTPLGRYIKIGADCLLKEREKQHGYGTYRLLIVTDGEATDGNKTDKYTPEVIARGITVDVIGVNMDKNHTLATKVHSYRRADDPASLKKAIADVFAEVSSVDDSAVGEETFEIIKAIPDEIVKGMLESLLKSGNHPIGEKPKIAKAQQVPAVQPPVSAPSKDNSWVVVVVVLVVAVLFVVVVVVLSRSY